MTKSKNGMVTRGITQPATDTLPFTCAFLLLLCRLDIHSDSPQWLDTIPETVIEISSLPLHLVSQ